MTGAKTVIGIETATRAEAETMTGAETVREAGSVYRIEWVPGTDRLLGTCHCGAVREDDDPVMLWEWLLAHPAHC